jgi:hypothetical protein
MISIVSSTRSMISIARQVTAGGQHVAAAEWPAVTPCARGAARDSQIFEACFRVALIMMSLRLHETSFGLLARNGVVPVAFTFRRKGNGHSSSDRENGEALTAELLWVAQSHTGDYHDNMNSDMYMRWVKNRLLPTFRC